MLDSFFCGGHEKMEIYFWNEGLTLYALSFKGVLGEGKKNAPPDKPGTHYRL